MSIYWMRTDEVYPDSGWHERAFMAFDPDVGFPRFHPTTGGETIGNVHQIDGGPQAGLWQWSITVSLPSPRYSGPTSGTELGSGPAQVTPAIWRVLLALTSHPKHDAY